MSEKKPQNITFEALLAGTPLFAFFMELAAIEEGSISDETLDSVTEGDVVLGEMLPFEKRLFAWVTLRKAQADQELRRIKETMCKTCAACDIAGADFQQACVDVVKFDDETNKKGVQFLQKSLLARFPDAEGMLLLRKGFMIAQVAKPENPKRSEVYIHVVSGPGLEGLFGALAGLARRKS